MRFAPTLAAACLPLLLSSPALAGPLAEVARGVENKSETHSDSGGGGAAHDSSSDTRTVEYDDDDSGCAAGCGSFHVSAVSSGDEIGPPLVLTGPGRVDLYLGMHSVVDSEGAYVGELRASKGWLGFGVAATSYFERVEGKPGEDSIRMDAAAFTVSGRILSAARTELWLDGGMATLGSSEFDTLLGTAWSLRGEHRLADRLSLFGQLRYLALEHDVSAAESWGGVRAWFLAVGYRALKFNFGPPLHGPEAAIALRF